MLTLDPVIARLIDLAREAEKRFIAERTAVMKEVSLGQKTEFVLKSGVKIEGKLIGHTTGLVELEGCRIVLVEEIAVLEHYSYGWIKDRLLP